MENASDRPIVLVGAGGHGAELAEIALESGYTVKGFLDTDEELYGSEINGCPVLGGNEWLEERASEVRVLVAIGDNSTRKRVVETLSGLGVDFATLISPAAHLSPKAEIGEGTVIFPGAVVSTRTKIGRHSILGTHSGVSHDCVLGDYCFLCPGARTTGAVTLGEGVMIGTNACVIPGKSVGDWTNVGAGAAVVRDLPAGVTAVGVPAKSL